MRMLRWLGREVAGVWRSVCYDLTRRPSLSRQRTEVLHPEYDAYERPPRRWYAAIGLGALVAAAVVAVYVAVAGGLGALLSPVVAAVPGVGPASPEVRPIWPPGHAQPVPSGKGAVGARGAAARHPSSAPPSVGTAPGPAAPGVGAEAAQPVPAPTCQCPTPVPTPQVPSPPPTDPPSPTPSPSVTHSASADPSGGAGTQP